MRADDDRIARADAVLAACRTQLDLLKGFPQLTKLATGLRELDGTLVALGQEMVGERIISRSFDGPDVYLATYLPKVGGHRRLMEDFLTALEDPGKSAHLFLSDPLGRSEAVAPEALENLSRRALNIHVLEGATPGAKLGQLVNALLELRPARLFLFHHPGDPIPVAAAMPELAGHRYLIHHSDAKPSLGLYLPGVHVIELHPAGAALSRVLGFSNEFLPLTSPDPGPRPFGFLRHGTLVTATSGRKEKFSLNSQPSYPEAVRTILATTKGRHVHLGPLTEPMLRAISSEIANAGVPPDAFLHIPWVDSISRALWEQDCDVYLSSFPVDGARTNAEVAAAGIPFLRHTRLRTAPTGDDISQPAGTMYWRTLEDLASRLQECMDVHFLEEKSSIIRRHYDQLHHPDIFRETLESILAGGPGMADPQEEMRELRRVSHFIRTLPTPDQIVRERGEWESILAAQQAQIRKLAAQNEKLAQKLSQLGKEQGSQQPQVKGWRGRVRRWLLGG